MYITLSFKIPVPNIVFQNQLLIYQIGAQVVMELVHMHEGLVRLPTVTRLVESGPSHVELQGGSTIAVAAVSKD